jgi:DNA-binding NtrC family response regulator
MEAMLEHSWPGNIRELENCVARLVALSSDALLHAEDLRFVSDRLAVHRSSGVNSVGPEPARESPEDWQRVNVGAESLSMAQTEQAAIQRALVDSNGSNSVAAKALGISRTTLYRKLKQYRGPIDESERSSRND